LSEVVDESGHILSDSEQLEQAMEVLRKHGKRGDSFDIGSWETGETKDLMNLLSNPKSLVSSFNLTEKQSENVAAIITGGAAGLGRKYLSNYIGPELAGAVSGFLGAVISKKVVGR